LLALLISFCRFTGRREQAIIFPLFATTVFSATVIRHTLHCLRVAFSGVIPSRYRERSVISLNTFSAIAGRLHLSSFTPLHVFALRFLHYHCDVISDSVNIITAFSFTPPVISSLLRFIISLHAIYRYSSG